MLIKSLDGLGGLGVDLRHFLLRNVGALSGLLAKQLVVTLDLLQLEEVLPV